MHYQPYSSVVSLSKNSSKDKSYGVEDVGPLSKKSVTPLVPTTKIESVSTFSHMLPEICQKIYNALGPQQHEGTYQMALFYDLLEAGLDVVLEAPIDILYKGKVVGHRRVDILVTFPNIKITNDKSMMDKAEEAVEERVVLEIKAVNALVPKYTGQLEYYMATTQAKLGYLINFPHAQGFPVKNVPRSSRKMLLKVASLFGLDDNKISDFQKETVDDHDHNHDPATVCEKNNTVEILTAKWMKKDPQSATNKFSTETPAPRPMEADRKTAIAKTTGLTCKICKAGGRLNCRHHGKSATPSTTNSETAQAESKSNKYAMAKSTGQPCKICIQNGGRQNCKWHFKKVEN
ncbi:hypothetical protein ACA910_018751 [Epithemia clementina (nom. ined.)]